MDDHCTAGAERTIATGAITEYRLHWPGAPEELAPMAGMDPAEVDGFDCCLPGGGSTHELVCDPGGAGEFWVSGQNYDHIARVDLRGNATYFAMPEGSLPHGTAFDGDGRLWVTFEGLGKIAQIGDDGTINRTVDVSIHSPQIDGPYNPRPHGLAIASDGTMWATGKRSNTIIRITPAGEVRHFVLPTIGAVPIYGAEGADGAMWFTELASSTIARISPEGAISELAIPTANSRPITIKPGPDGRSVWFTQEAGGKLGRIRMEAPAAIDEFPVPLTTRDSILAGHTFDRDGNLWVQEYLSPPAHGPAGDDHIIRIDKAILDAPAGDLSGVGITYYKAPSRRTVMHRITEGPDGTIWFSELGLDRIAKLTPHV